MRAILPGRPQSKRQAVCTARWDGLRLVAYISGSTVVILRNPKDIIQTISIDHVEALSATTIDESSGRIAICDERRVLVFDAVGRDQGDLRWTQTQDIIIPHDGRARCLSWGGPEELLVGGTKLWLYHVPYSEDPRIIWEQPLANEVSMAYFSNDAELIASCGEHDRLVKIWRRLSFELDSTRFDVSYLPHPAAVTDLHWRNPWHKEQNLDTLLYTFCSDNQVRVWTYSDPHSLSVVQLVATIDTKKSIEPRRRSIGSISRKRYVFIFDSRDFLNATEKAIQKLQNRSVDHALEHLVEIANRSPELCVVFDGLGHMSVWGIENAGYKTKKPTQVFNVTLVDQVDVQLRFDQDDYIRLCAFGGGLNEASLSLLVHSYTGQVDWYESPIAHFFDTASRTDRVELLSSWSGHDSTIDHIARGPTGERILSWTEQGHGILWSQSQTGALRRHCEFSTNREIMSTILLDSTQQVLVLHSSAVSLWDTSSAHGTEIVSKPIMSGEIPTALKLIEPSHQSSAALHVAISFKNGSWEVWQVKPPADDESLPNMNGNHSPLSKVSVLRSKLSKTGWPIPCDFDHNDSLGKRRGFTSANLHVDEVGYIKSCAILLKTSSGMPEHQMVSSIQTNFTHPTCVRAHSSGKCALVAEDRKCLTIWDSKQGVCEWRYQHKGTDDIQKLAWTSTPKGNLLLFVGFSYSALFVGQFRYPAASVRQSAWYITQNISLRDFTTNHIGDVCWLPSGDIAIAAGHQIFVLENIVTKHGSPIIKRSQQLIGSNSAAAVVDMACTALPVFRADFLEASVMNHGLKRAENILRRLYEKLKYFSEGDELPSDLDLSLDQILSGTNHNPTAAMTKMNGNAQEAFFEPEDVEESFIEYLDRSEIWQLGPKRCHDVSIILKNLIQAGRYRNSLDENGLRYLCTLYSTPTDRDLPWSAFVFASRSTSQEALIDLITQQHDGKLTWSIARRSGLFVWLEDRAALQTQFENIARTEFNKSEDRNPVDCSLYYLALNKKSVLQSLWRMTYGSREKENTMKLLANNFDLDRWKATALKNAYALLSKRRFEYAAAFFLLGSSLKDAVNVCVNQLQDIQLAIAVARAWDKDVQQSEDVLQDLLRRHVLAKAVDSEQGRWMAAWAYSLLQQPAMAIQSIVRPLHQVIATDLDEYDGPICSMSYRVNDPCLNVLYTQLRQAFVKQNKWTTDILTQKEEWDFVLRCANWWVRAGMDYLAVQLLKEWTFVPHQEPRQANAPTTLVVPVEDPAESEIVEQSKADVKDVKKNPAPTQFYEPSANSLLDSFGF